MAWQDEMGELLRVMVFDLATPPTYPDSSVERLLVAAAVIVGREMEFSLVYAGDLANTDIVPDPTDADGATRDEDFIALVCMKAAAIIDQGVARQQSGIVIRDNGSMVDLHYKLQAALALLESSGGWTKLYEDRKFRYCMGLVDAGGTLVLSAFRTLARDVNRLECGAGFLSRGEWGD